MSRFQKMSHLAGVVCAWRSTRLHSAAAEKLLLRLHLGKRGAQMQLGRTCALCRTHGSGASVSIDPLVSLLDVQAGGPFALSHEIKPRARRGQATDAHSISERLRRERIAERMKSLQNLLPDSVGLDKASMLDGLIEYVRFLQMQAKVLSLGDLGGEESVACARMLQKEELESLFHSTSKMTEKEMEELADQVVPLLESDMASAMQLLHAHGMCLVPQTLARDAPPPQGDWATKPIVKKEEDGSLANDRT